jgi:outer membrane receptor protein involved in Fe transport
MGICGLCAVVVASTAQAATPLSSDIAPQPLAQALASFARQTGLQVVYLSESARTRLSQGARAGLAPAAALTELLENTGLRFEFLNARTVRAYAVHEGSSPTAASPHDAHRRPGDPHDALAEIIITGLRTREDLSHAPMSVAVWTQESMEASGIKDIADIGALTPGLAFEWSSYLGAAAYTYLNIRGVNDLHGAGVGVFIDDTPLPAAWHDTYGYSFPSTFDLDRVEVLRGPQGALLGQGTLGGAVRFHFNQPSLTTYSARARAEWATTARGEASYEAGAAFGGPVISNVLGLRVSGWYRSDGGYVDRVDPFTGATVDHNGNRTVNKIARASLTWAAASSLSITPSLTYQLHSQSDTSAFYTYLSDPAAGVLRNGSLVPVPFSDTFVLAGLKVTAALGAAELSAVTSYFDRRAKVPIENTSCTSDCPLGPPFLSSYADAQTLQIELTQNMLSQELRFTSTDPQAPLKWVAGVYYSSARLHAAIWLDPARGELDWQYRTVIDQDRFEGFAQISGQISRRFTADIGWRLAHTTGKAVTAALFTTRAHDAESAAIPSFELSYQTNERNLYYLTAAKGYRSGGFIPQYSGCEEPPSAFTADTVWSYELGAKNDLLNGRLHLDGSIFHISISNDQQDPLTAPCAGLSQNGAAVSNGFDLTAQSLLTEHTRLGLAVAYTDAHYARDITLDGAVIVHAGDAFGLVPVVTSPWKLTASIEYRINLRGGATTELRAEDSFRSRNPGPFYTDNPASPFYSPGQGADPSTNRLNLRATLRWTRSDLALFVNNALDSRPTVQRTSNFGQGGIYQAYTFRPRTIGLTANWQY